MDKSMKTLIIGAVCGLAIASVGVVINWQLQQKLDGLVKTCAAERDKRAGGFKPFCDPRDLAAFDSGVGIQGEIISVQRQLDWWDHWLQLLGLAIAVGLALPWCWYFLLNRIRELRDATIGK
jgi:hypothetical protein